MRLFPTVVGFVLFLALGPAMGVPAQAAAEADAPAAEEVALPEGTPESLRDKVMEVAAKVKPALVRISVVEADYQDGREVKYNSSGSGVIITPEGHVVTNHHVAGHAARLFVTLANREEVEAELVGTDPLTDIAVIKLENDGTRTYPTAEFGDSSTVEVGDRVLAMGSPMALSQSVTLGIVSNAELVMPRMMRARGAFTLDGEDVGSFVRWIGHDAAIYPGNSGGPLVNVEGKIVGINEISMSLGGAIPSNVAKAIAEELIKTGKIRRAWVGMQVQPRLKHSAVDRGILVSSVMPDSPATAAGLKSGDTLVKVNDTDVDVRFDEQLPAFNRMVASLPIGEPARFVVLRNGEEVTLDVTPTERGEVAPKQQEIKPWGITGRNLSYMIAREMKRDNTDGVLVTSVRPGGPAGSAKPNIQPRDVIVKVNDTPVNNLDDLRSVTDAVMAGREEPTPALVTFDRDGGIYVTVVKIGIEELDNPGRALLKAWLPVKTQVLTRDIAEQMGRPDMKGFRVIEVYPNSSAEEAGLRVGDIILAVDDIRLEASEPEHYEELRTLVRQYKKGSTAELSVFRDGQETKVAVLLPEEPRPQREMGKYRDELFEFTTRDITFFDKADQKWEEEQRGVLVEEVTPGGWAALGQVYVGDLILEVDGTPISDVQSMEAKMDEVAAAKPKAVVIKVLRGIHRVFLEIEPNWDTEQA